MSNSFRILTLSGFLSVTVLGFSSAHAVTLFNNGTGACLASEFEKTNPRNPLDDERCSDSFGQEWNWESFGIQGIGTNSRESKCVDVAGAGTADGTLVQLFDCNSTVAQQWAYVNKQIVNPHSNKWLDGNGQLGTAIRTCNGGPTQQWSLR